MKNFILFLSLSCMTAFVHAQITKSVVLTAGNLSTTLTASELNAVTNLTLTGTMNALDFKTMRDAMPALESIDLSGVSISAYTGNDATGGVTYPTYPANAIPQYAFFSTSTLVGKTTLTSIVLPANVTSIERSAFYGCTGLISITLPNSVSSIKRSAFGGCSQLTTVNIPSAVTAIEDYTFSGCQRLQSINLPASVTSIGKAAFLRSGISTINLPENLLSIGDHAFQNCGNLTTLNIPASVKYIGYCAFTWNNSLISFTVDAANTSFSALDGVLYDKQQKNLVSFPNGKCESFIIPGGVTSIDTAAFEGSASIKDIYIPSSVTKICTEAFYSTSLETVDIPSSVNSIEPYAFKESFNLKTIYCNITNPVSLQTIDSVFGRINKTACNLYVPVNSKTLYQNANEWTDFPNITEFLSYHVTVPDGTKDCYFAGEITSWAQQKMTKIDATHYYKNYPNATTSQQYKYCSGPGWAYVENIADNRTYTANDVVASWSQVYDPTVIPTEVTYHVAVPTGTNTCYFAGAATNWAHQEMIKVDANHYQITINTSTPDKYKYCSGPSWNFEELDANSQPISDRNYTANDVVIKWKAVYVPPLPGVTYNVTVPAGTKACYIAGEMNGWVQTAMDKLDDTHFSLNIPTATTNQKYKYCSGPDWTYEELDANNNKITDRTYSTNDVVIKWTAIYDPDFTIAQIPNTLTVSSGTVTRYSFNVPSINNRTVDVWLPAGYTASKKYAVLYMHDGQMLYDATQTWNGQEWKVDETLSQLMTNGEIKDIIVVGIWNSSNRYSEYYPEKSLDYLPESLKPQIIANLGNNPKADEYLAFIVNTLKPFIDRTYSVNTDKANTFIAGSSMGGLISWYALCEYPDVFGGAICMSTHWADNSVDDPSIPDSFRKYLLAKLPDATTHKIYFDHGTVDLDANYAVHQVLVDTIMQHKGYSAANWESLVFTGDGHNEVAWANRFSTPAKFMLKPGLSIAGVDMVKINNKIEVLSHHGRIWGIPSFSTFTYPFKLLTASEYQAQKQSDAFAFDAGFVATDGTINISEPATAEQQAVFPDLTHVALYYLCQSYMYHFYQTRNIPLLFKIGFPVFEAGIIPTDATIKTAVNAYGGSFSSFDVLNDRTDFINKNGLAVAGAFGEFMNVFKNWGYPMITNISSTGFNVASYWFNVDNLAGLLGDFNRYVSHRFLEADENLRIQKYMETEHFKYYTRPVDGALNFPFFSEVTENAVVEYSNNFNVKFAEKLSYFTLPACVDGEVEGFSCNGEPPVRVAGGTAWSSGMHSTCASTADQLPLFYHMNRHELAHAFQGILPQGNVTAWLNEGFPQFCAAGAMTDATLNEMRQSGIDCMANSIKYFGHRPTYEETRIYPSPDYGYYTLGQFLVDYQYKRGGYPLVKAVQMNDLAAYQSLGYASAQAFLEDFYFDFDVRVQQKPIVTLINPVNNVDETNPTVNISWTPLKADVKLNISISTDDGKSWTEVVNHTTNTSCVWNSGNLSTRFYIRISAPDNLNISTTYGPFTKSDLTGLSIVSPANNHYAIAGDTLNVKWASTNIQNIKLEYSTNNGSDWILINNNTATSSEMYKWIVPSNLTGTCKLKITNTENASVYSESEQFNIVSPNNIGGPYLYDKNTLLLLHFDNDLNNRSFAVPNAIGNMQSLTDEASTIPNLGRSYKTTSVLSVPHHANLNLTGDWTIEAWVKLTSYNANSNMYLFWKPGDTDTYQSNFSLEVNPWWGNVFYGYYFSELNSRLGLTGPSPALNEWYHVAFTRNTSNKMLKVIVHDKNRNLISTTEMTYSPTQTLINSNDLLIGTGLTGYIDEVRISNTIRTYELYTENNKVISDDLFKVYPNPSNGIFYFSTNSYAEKADLSVISLDGRTVLRKSLSGECRIDLTNEPKGIYLLKIASENDTKTLKLIVQ